MSTGRPIEVTPDPGGENLVAAPEPLGYPVAAVARRLGIAPATLRTWDRRYGLGPSQHAAGAHRRYSPADVARLEGMRRLVLSGMPPGEAARSVLEEPLDPAAIDAGAQESAGNEDATIGRQGGGRVVPIPGGTPAARGLARAALGLDAEACAQIMTDTLERRGAVWTWDHLILPVLIGVGQRWQRSGSGIDVEHVLSGSVQSVLGAWAARPREARGIRPVLLASAPGEAHCLPLWAVTAALAERGVDARSLGASTPWSALAEAARRIGPGGILVWSQTPLSGDAAELVTLPPLRPEPIVVLGGPGWAPTPARWQRAHDLTEAVDLLARASGA